MSLDEYEPALTDTTTDETGAESTITTRDEAGKTAPVLMGGEVGDDPSKPPGQDPRGQRQVSDKTKALMRSIAAAAAKAESEGAAADLSGVSDDLVPMDHEEALPQVAAAAVPDAGAPPLPASPPAVAAPAALPLIPLPIPAAPTPPVQAAPDPAIAERAKQMDAREAAIAEREKLLPDITALIERPGATLAAWLKSVYQVSDDLEMESVIQDVTAELSEVGLKTKLPSEFKGALESRKAARAVRALRSDIGRREQALVDQRAAADKAAAETRAAAELQQYEANAAAQMQAAVAPAKANLQFLHDPEITDGLTAGFVVWEIVKEQKNRADQWLKANPGYQLPEELRPSVERAAKIGNDYYKGKAEAFTKKADAIKTKLSPTPAKPAATATASPGAAPGPAAKPVPSVARPAAQESSADTDEYQMDRRDRRAAGARALFAKHFKKQQPTQ